MRAFARALSDEEIVQVASHIAAMPAPETVGFGDSAALEEGGQIYAERCAACHGPTGSGSPAVPALCGQHAGYLLRRMNEIAGGVRADADPAMAALVQGLPEDQRSAVADFLSRCTETAAEGR